MSQPETTRQVSVMLDALTDQRGHVLGILEGLSDEALRRAVLPSGWTCLGMIQHLALDIERFWFRAVMAGEKVDLKSGADAWQVAPEVSAEAVLDLYRQEFELANAIITATPLDAPPAWWPADLFGSWRMDDLQEVIMHVITETASHAGHLDAVRELLDGRQWLVLTD